ncbi:MAG TPA: hypothetical protein VHK63_04045 [Candidatus Limnocylindria bacterium]|nr:hypothetical protein [Candidatus Limnocylindria bacterium]
MEPQPIGPASVLAREEHVRFGWLARLLGRGLAVYIRLVARTASVSGPPVSQEQVVFAIWHEANLVAAAAAYRLRPGHVHVSFSTRRFRGIVMNAMLHGLGWGAVTPPEPGQRAEATSVSRAMAAVGRTGKSLVASCDGPTGPPRVAKPGVLIVARESGLPVLPWAVAARPSMRLKRRWDRQVVPLPFSRLRVYEGPMFRVGRRDRIKPILTALDAELMRIAELADLRMGDGP